MFGLASPSDLQNAFVSAQKAEARGRDLERLGAGPKGTSFEDILASLDAKYLRPDRGILAAMDAGRNADEERRTGRKTTGAFDSLVSAQVAGALGGLYQDPSVTPNLAAENPFTTSSALGQFTPRISKEAMRVAESYGFPVAAVFGNGQGLRSATSYGSPAMTSGSGSSWPSVSAVSGWGGALAAGGSTAVQALTQLYSSTAAPADKSLTRSSSGAVPRSGPSMPVSDVLAPRKSSVLSRIARGL